MFVGVSAFPAALGHGQPADYGRTPTGLGTATWAGSEPEPPPERTPSCFLKSREAADKAASLRARLVVGWRMSSASMLAPPPPSVMACIQKKHAAAVAVAALLALAGLLLVLCGLTLSASLAGLTAAAPLLLLSSPVVVPAALLACLLATGGAASAALALGALTILSRLLRKALDDHYYVEQGKRRVGEPTATPHAALAVVSHGQGPTDHKKSSNSERTPQIGHDGSATTWLSGNEAGERAARARREGILHLKGQAEQQCNAYQTRRGALGSLVDGFLAHIKHALRGHPWTHGSCQEAQRARTCCVFDPTSGQQGAAALRHPVYARRGGVCPSAISRAPRRPSRRVASHRICSSARPSVPTIKPRAAPSPSSWSSSSPLRLSLPKEEAARPLARLHLHGALLYEMPRGTRRGATTGPGGRGLLHQMRRLREVRRRRVLAHPGRRAPAGSDSSDFVDADVKNAVTPTTIPKVENGPPSEITLDEFEDLSVLSKNDDSTVSITVVGASGDLAKKKIFPALFALYYEDCLPKHFTIFGYARSKMTDSELRNMVSKTLTCRIDKRENCSEKMEEFLKRCFYHSGQYDSEEHFVDLDKKLKQHEGSRVSNRLFYLSIPPNIFLDVVKCASKSASSVNGWTRVIVEKPFGRDSESSAALTRGLKQYLVEDQIFRIDHYLGKELVENLSVLRFSNLVFEPLWSRQYIRNVQLIFSEDFGTEGRGGYFDGYGIIRDIMQNHLLQILALFAMETPISLEAEDIRNEKVKVLRSMKPLQLEDVVIGQYKSHTRGGITYPGYTDDQTVPKDSVTPTFAAAALFINNARWDGVPFLMKAGKALHTKRAEIRVQFRHVPGNLYKGSFGTDLDRATNELVIRVQPDEAIYLKINNKIPGLGMRLDRSNLNLHYAARYSKEIPDAYERLLLDAIEGERRLFIRSDELDAAWSLFTPLLKELEEKRIAPELYPYGSRGPVGAHYLAAKYNVRWGDLSAEHYKA